VWYPHSSLKATPLGGDFTVMRFTNYSFLPKIFKIKRLKLKFPDLADFSVLKIIV
jgi:hypothetical protein